MHKPLRIAIVAGEISGDLLGADLMRAMLERYPDAQFEGVGGPRMLAQGFVSHYSMERLAVMGLVEPLKRLPELLRMRRELRDRYRDDPPDLFIGIDAPDFNLSLEQSLRERGIKTAHYVSPSVWAWRQGRVKKIAKAVDMMLTLFPFEERFYLESGVPVTCVGHPLADQFPIEPDRVTARRELGYADDARVVAVMPGSRGGEVRLLARDFIETARWCYQRDSSLKFILPAANQDRYDELRAMLEECGEGLPIELIQGNSHRVLEAADAVLMASGTTTLEAMLFKCPMVVAYRMAPLSYAIISRLVKSPYVSLPNLLAQRELVPEVMQDEVTPEVLGPLLLERVQNRELRQTLVTEFTAIHQHIRRDASHAAATALFELIGR